MFKKKLIALEMKTAILTILQIIYLTCWMRKNIHAARAVSTFVHFSTQHHKNKNVKLPHFAVKPLSRQFQFPKRLYSFLLNIVALCLMPHVTEVGERVQSRTEYFFFNLVSFSLLSFQFPIHWSDFDQNWELLTSFMAEIIAFRIIFLTVHNFW